MIKNFFLVAWRNIWRNKGFSLTNIAGLSIGMTCTLLIFLWVYNEKSWDKSHKNYDRIYHIHAARKFNTEINTGSDMMYPLGAAVKANFPEVEKSAVVSFGNRLLLEANDKRLNAEVITVSPDFPDIFTHPVVEGDLQTAVKDPDAIVLTETLAKNLFGTTSIIGKDVEVNNNRRYVVRAVIKDVSKSSTVSFEAIQAFNPSSEQIQAAERDWVNCGVRVFVKTNAGADISSLEKKIINLIRKNTSSANATTKGEVILHPMSKWRLYGEFQQGKNAGGRIEYVNLFSWIAIVILLIACINFMNLSTARSEKRAREVGVRKTLGSERYQLWLQFLSESIVLSLLAFIISAMAVTVLTVPFGKLLNQEIVIPYSNINTWLIVLSVVVATGLVSGSYPAFYLSSFNPIKVLKGSFFAGKKGLMPRKTLVTGQFIVSVILLSATLVIYQQLQYVKNRNVGYNKNNLLAINSSSDLDRNYEAFKNDLMQSGLVQSVTRTTSPLTEIYNYTAGLEWEGAEANNNLVIGQIGAHDGFARTLEVKIAEGRDFQQGDSNSIMFNKTAIQTMGIKNPVGKVIRWFNRERRIIAVLEDMIMTSPYEPAVPLMVSYLRSFSSNVNIRIANNVDLSKAIAQIENVYKKYSIEYPFEYRFVDEAFNQKFASEQLIGRLSLIFAGLAIFICCLGLFGLVASSLEQRKKEIGIRKVLGASVQGLLLLMSKDFLILVAIAFTVAIPAAWWAMNNWLQNFNYRIEVGVGVFIIVGLILLTVTIITVGLNAAKAAMNKPVNSLRSE